MTPKDLFVDDDAVSSVIGIVLVVAITVILTTIIGTFVLEIGGSQQSTPHVTWEFEEDPTGPSSVSVSHGGGDTVWDPQRITVRIDHNRSSAAINEDGATLETVFGQEKVSAGDEAVVYKAVSSGEGDATGTVELVWESADGTGTQLLQTHEFEI